MLCRRILTSSLLLFLTISAASCGGRCPDDPGVYCDRVNGFHITFPVDWEVEADPGGGRAVVARAPLEEGSDADVEGTSFEVMVLRLESDPDLDEFFGGYVRRLPGGKPYYQHHDSGEIKVGGRKTKYILYAIDTEPRIEARLEYIQKKGGCVYIFRGVTRGVQFNEFHDRFREIAYTFRLI
jgi:hypothetical protein